MSVSDIPHWQSFWTKTREETLTKLTKKDQKERHVFLQDFLDHFFPHDFTLSDKDLRADIIHSLVTAWFLQKVDKIVPIHHSVHYSWKNYRYEWGYIHTKEKIQTVNGLIAYGHMVSNRGYLHTFTLNKSFCPWLIAINRKKNLNVSALLSALGSMAFIIYVLSKFLRGGIRDILLVQSENFGIAFWPLLWSILLVVFYVCYLIAKHVIEKDRVVLDDSRFEKKYQTYADDPISSREFMTWDMMEKIMHIQETYNKDNTYEFLFHKNIMIIFSNYRKNTKNFFSFHKAKKEQFAHLYHELLLIKNATDLIISKL